jgi:TetR/AcrR family transcriptional regulator, fatty acid metabolism regulator protein
VAYRTTPKMAQRKQARQRRLLDEAISIFGKKGYHLATVPMIVAAACTSIGSFYFYFRNKEDIFAAALREIENRIAAALNEAITAAGSDVLAQMRAAVTAFVEFLARHPDEARAPTGSGEE